MVLGLGFVIGLPGVTAVLAETANPRTESASLPVAGLVALGTVLVLPVVLMSRLQPTLHEFDAGLASVSVYRRRVTVVRWADLAAVSRDIGEDSGGGWYFYGYLFQDHAGNAVHIGRRGSLLLAKAEQVLAGRPGGCPASRRPLPHAGGRRAWLFRARLPCRGGGPCRPRPAVELSVHLVVAGTQFRAVRRLGAAALQFLAHPAALGKELVIVECSDVRCLGGHVYPVVL